MKLWEKAVLLLIGIVFALIGVFFYGYIQERNNPPLRAQKMAMDLDKQLADLNEGLSNLYIYQKMHNIKSVEYRVLPVAKEVYDNVTNPKKKPAVPVPPAPPAVKTTMGVK